MGPMTRRILAWLLPSAAVCALLLVLGWNIAAAILGATIAARLLLELLVPATAAALSREVKRAAQLLGDLLAAGVLGLLHALVIVPIWLVTWPSRARAAKAAPEWRVPAHDRRYSHRPFSTPAAPRRWWWVAPLAAAALTGAAAVLLVTERPSAVRRTDPPAALVGQPGIEQIQPPEDEILMGMTQDASLGWRLPANAGSGDMTTDINGNRSSVQVTDDANVPEVWFFGGSTMFGTAHRNGETIPSQVAARLAESGRPVRVRNFGVHAYTSMQEVDAFEAALQASPVAPAVAVFYDGSNDLSIRLHSELLGQPVGSPTRAALEIGDVAPTFGKVQRLSPPSVRLDGVANAYSEAVARARRLGDEYGVTIINVWQPVVFSRTPTRGEVAAIRAKGIDAFHQAVFARLFKEVRSELPEGVIDLSDAFNGAPTVFYDEVHVNEAGATIVADEMAPVIVDALDPPN